MEGDADHFLIVIEKLCRHHFIGVASECVLKV